MLKMRNNVKYFCLLHIVLVLFSLTSVASKVASGAEFLSFDFILYYGLTLAGLFVYAILWQQVIKHMPLITAYASKAVTIIWGIVFGYFIFDEKLTVRSVIGGIIIVLGVFLIVTGDARDEEKRNDSKSEVSK